MFLRCILAGIAILTVLMIAMGTGAYFGAVTSPYGQALQSGPILPDGVAAIQVRDLAAQEAMAKWAYWMLVASAVGIVITAVGTCLLLWQIVLTRRAVADTSLATKAMNKQNELADQAQRPWIALDIEYDFLTSSASGLCLSVTAKLRNIGKMPAYRANIQHYLHIGHMNPIEEFRECAELPRDDDAIYQSRLIVLPGGDAQDQVLLFMDKDDPRLPFEGGVVPQFMVTVFYQLPDGREAQTSAWFSAAMPDPDFENGGPIPWNLVANHRDPIIEGYGYVRVT